MWSGGGNALKKNEVNHVSVLDRFHVVEYVFAPWEWCCVALDWLLGDLKSASANP
jgi:hypothetical protein